jgi:hypothetical protein
MSESSGRLTRSAPPLLHVEQLVFDEAVHWAWSDKSADSPCSYDDIDLVCYEEYLSDDISYSHMGTSNLYSIDIDDTPDRFTQLVANALRVRNRRGLLLENANTLVLDEVLYVSDTDFVACCSTEVPFGCDFAFSGIRRRLRDANVELYRYVSMRTKAGVIVSAVAICDSSLTDDNHRPLVDAPYEAFFGLDPVCCCDIPTPCVDNIGARRLELPEMTLDTSLFRSKHNNHVSVNYLY